MESIQEMSAFAEKEIDGDESRPTKEIITSPHYCFQVGNMEDASMNMESGSGVVSGASAENAASVLMARKALDVQKQQGEANVRLIESSNAISQNEYTFSVIV